MLREIADGLLAVLLAPPCAACHIPLDSPTRGAVCDACWNGIGTFTPPLCESCGDPLPSWRAISRETGRCPRCRRRQTVVTRSRAIGEYEGPLRAIIQAFKYQGRRSLAVPLAALMRRHGASVLERADLVVPVPLHARRRRQRGFNQAEDLARQLGLPLRLALRRRRHTQPQADLPEGRRHANVRGAFVQAQGTPVRGCRVVLVDDVCTTGATLEACARALVAAGAAEVSAITAARVVSKRR